MNISVVVPVYNEELAIAGNIAALESYLDGAHGNSWELILIDDGSTDNSLSFMREAARRVSRIHAISYPTNRGRGYALRRGFREATGDIVVSVESDMNYGVETVDRMVHELKTTDTDTCVIG